MAACVEGDVEAEAFGRQGIETGQIPFGVDAGVRGCPQRQSLETGGFLFEVVHIQRLSEGDVQHVLEEAAVFIVLVVRIPGYGVERFWEK